MNESPEKVDMVVAMLVIKNEDDLNNYFDRVTEVLSQSDRVRELKKSLPMNDYLVTAQKYVGNQFESAVQARKEVAVERQRDFDLSR